MTYEQIAKSLAINRKTATKACRYKRRYSYVPARHFPVIASFPKAGVAISIIQRKDIYERQFVSYTKLKKPY